MKKEIKLIIILLTISTTAFLMGCVQTLDCPTGTANEIDTLSQEQLVSYVQYYRDKDWCKTTEFPTGNGGLISNPNLDEIKAEAGKLFIEGEGDSEEGTFSNQDARFVDFDIDQLKNYICMIESSANGNQINTLRFYYIKYPDGSIKPHFKNKHSLAIVPVIADENSEEEVLKDNAGNSMIANHGNLIPPMKPNSNCILQTADN